MKQIHTQNTQSQDFSCTPLITELAGSISLPENYDYKEDYTTYLENKYE